MISNKNDYIDSLFSNILFKNIDKGKINDLRSYVLKSYKKHEIIAVEGDKCNYVGVIIGGSIEISRILPSGKNIILKILKENSVFGEAIIFSKHADFPATITAAENCTIINIKREEILRLCSEDKGFLENFMCTLSEKILMLNKKIKNISFSTIRQKTVNYIIEQSQKQKSNNIILNKTKEEIAAELGIPRPSFSRELVNLRNDNFIEFDRKNIRILDYEQLENLLLE